MHVSTSDSYFHVLLIKFCKCRVAIYAHQCGVKHVAQTTFFNVETFKYPMNSTIELSWTSKQNRCFTDN